jgi:hypothetical protein
MMASAHAIQFETKCSGKFNGLSKPQVLHS